ncbi:MAG: hypothetical protein RLZZ618_481 [Pseudomonadota bacterium]|jgi:signal transduction histidine kinase/CheY-like chemotaxis protein
MPEATSNTATARLAPTPQLRLVKDHLRRNPYALTVIDCIVAWLLMRNGAPAWIIGWVVLSAAVQGLRAVVVRRIELTDPQRIASELRTIDIWFFIVGMTRLVPVVVVFGGVSRQDDYLITMIMIGLAAGGVGTAAGMARAYLCWAVPVGLALVVGWLSRGGFEDRWVSVLLVMLFALLTLTVHSNGRTLDQLRDEAQRANNERDRAEAAQAVADEERGRAERAVLAKTRFFASASHDLRQPLGVLRWYGDAVQVYADRLGHEPLNAIAQGIGRALEHAEPLVGKYLDIARIDAGALDLAPRPVQVAQLFEQLRQAFAHDAQARRLALHTQFDSPASELAVFTDESLLRSILDNLVGNALKFTSTGGVTLSAGRFNKDGLPLVRIAVRDTGMGIPSTEHERVFEDFYQLDNPDRSSRSSKGLGLGLSIVRRQAELLETRVRLVSAPDCGATFEFDLPALVSSTPLVPVALQADALTAVPKGLRVLVIDDEPEVRTALRLMLECVDWEVHTAEGLGEALSELHSGFRPNVLVVDHRLHGGQTGPEVIAELRRAGFDVPAVMVTGDTSPAHLIALRDTELPVLHKPVEGALLITTLLEASGVSDKSLRDILAGV